MGRSDSVISTQGPQQGFLGLLARIIWAALAPGMALLLAVAIVQKQGGLTHLDLFYWLAAFAMIGARLLDVAVFHGTTSDGEPATMATWRRFALVVAAAAVGVWGLVHGVAKLLG